MTAVVRAESLSHGYERLAVIKDVTFSLHPGETLALMAPSGAGKTTLLRVLLGLEQPTAGSCEILVGSADIGVAFQEDSLLPWLTVERNVLLLNDLTERRYDAALFEECLAFAGLAAFRDKLPNVLSTGMKQKVALCRLLVYQPRVYVLDESMANIDDVTRFQFCDRFRSKATEESAAVLLVTHSSTDALHMADRILVGTGRPLEVAREFTNPLPCVRDYELRFTKDFGVALEELRRCEMLLR